MSWKREEIKLIGEDRINKEASSSSREKREQRTAPNQRNPGSQTSASFVTGPMLQTSTLSANNQPS
jgi:hypothetical protein